ncbi:hypothetical protein A2926_01670 [Candidatus Giovannonibacteria bacterium RIFCSPLOWO2_01_FULL_44_40]|uniref:Uncharacterized protein n=1 Tax=Candidatus Giovannonibacteria bacterium RIFCSPHIGHO2_01_FULL_45_23 TaxID=1798325 RepID=A0A1F5VF35_9BACT|nr:MAG: hypothetical protein A2834_01860 [Candidatus Giovannonibacteria bacterium RIFCSPHIGHO2_01_FULL_45_23]OGF75049.1 MAG: hypothetical protein A3C77_03960 [Candidatus Giovannonibacteria bacterium RIFCSPHIGHO2_02_FULL_45_13]OGF79872.1 MAG: hypothetical protein A2926_01670 [Candidatus Giovannonibacteria bacterium RIFCSPLOWO2_01_FULL_44_40]
MKIYKDSENLGWVGCVHFDRAQQSMLLVKNLKRQSQVEEEMKKRGFEDADSQRRHKREIMDYLVGHGLLQKPGKWELLGGKIAFWQGNPDLQREFIALSDKERPGITTGAQKLFLDKVWKMVLYDEDRLIRAADCTADAEYVEEGGLIIGQKTLLLRHDDKDRDNPNNTEAFYPRFWYLVESIGGGELRTEAIKKTISAPKWIPLLQLHPYFRDSSRYYPFHPAHVPGVIAAARYFIKRDDDDFFKVVVQYLEKTYGKLKTETTAIKEQSWEELTKSVEPLHR